MLCCTREREEEKESAFFCHTGSKILLLGLLWVRLDLGELCLGSGLDCPKVVDDKQQ